MSVKIVNDSASNLFTFEGNYACVPLKIITDAKEYVDDGTLDMDVFQQEMRQIKTKTSTSCPNAQEWLDAFGQEDDVFAISITSSLSGSYNAAIQAKEMALEENPNRKIHVVDSKTAGPSQVLIARKLQELLQQNLSFDHIVEMIESYRDQLGTLFCLEHLQNLVRNGRISGAIATITGLLGIRIIGEGSKQGTIELLTKARGTKKTIEALVNCMKEKGYLGAKVCIAHANNLTFAQDVAKAIMNQFPQAVIDFMTCGALCSYYAEDQGIIIGFEK